MDERFGFLWVVDQPAAIITQTVHEHAGPDDIEAFHDILDELIALGFIASNPGAVIIHDWRSIRSVAPGARETWVRRSSARLDKPLKTLGASYIALSVRSIVRMAIQTSALAVQLATGQPPIQVIEDPVVALTAYGILPPPADTFLRMRSLARRR